MAQKRSHITVDPSTRSRIFNLALQEAEALRQSGSYDDFIVANIIELVVRDQIDDWGSIARLVQQELSDEKFIKLWDEAAGRIRKLTEMMPQT